MYIVFRRRIITAKHVVVAKVARIYTLLCTFIICKRILNKRKQPIQKDQTHTNNNATQSGSGVSQFRFNHTMLHGVRCMSGQLLRPFNWHLLQKGATVQLSRSFCSDEAEKAKTAAKSANTTTVFDKIIDKTLPVNIVYEDEKCIAFHDIAPQAPVHFLVVPKERIDMIENATTNDHNVMAASSFED